MPMFHSDSVIIYYNEFYITVHYFTGDYCIVYYITGYILRSVLHYITCYVICDVFHSRLHYMQCITLFATTHSFFTVFYITFDVLHSVLHYRLGIALCLKITRIASNCSMQVFSEQCRTFGALNWVLDHFYCTVHRSALAIYISTPNFQMFCTFQCFRFTVIQNAQDVLHCEVHCFRCKVHSMYLI